MEEMRYYASKFPGKGFFRSNEQQDAEEFLGVLIENCKNLKSLTSFETITTRTCMNCLHQTPGGEELNRTLLSCPIVMEENAVNSTAEMIRKSSSTLRKICSSSKINDDPEGKVQGSLHSVSEILIDPSEVFIVTVKRFDERRRKITKAVNPSPIVSIPEENGQIYYLKSVVKHAGPTIRNGHYTTALNMKGRWLICDDKNLNMTEQEPLDGYIYLYEKAH